MPIYEYVCKKCDKVFEELVVRRDDEARVRCPECKGRVGKVISRPAARVGGGDGGTRSGPGCGPVG